VCSSDLDAAPLFTILIWSAVASTLISVATTLLVAKGEARLPLFLLLPLIPLSAGLYWVTIPHWGAWGAACVSALIAVTGAVASLWGVWWSWRVAPPAGTLWRCLITSGFVWMLCRFCPSPGNWVLAKLVFTSVFIPFFFYMIREFTAAEIEILKKTLQGFIQSHSSPKTQ
jgi:O-antigen/teichoic acid export membrane protein